MKSITLGTFTFFLISRRENGFSFAFQVRDENGNDLMQRPDILTSTLRVVNSEWQDVDGVASKLYVLTVVARVKERITYDMAKCGTNFNFD